MVFTSRRCTKDRRNPCLCVDYRGLNSKTPKDHHPLPQIQDTLDIVGSQRFIVLGQGKACHQGLSSQTIAILLLSLHHEVY